MPCRDYDDYNVREAIDEIEERSKKKLDKVTRLLCETLKKVEGTAIETEVLLKGGELAEWWTEHKKQDAKRLAAEREKKRKAKVRREALRKLNKEERQLLGLKN